MRHRSAFALTLLASLFGAGCGLIHAGANDLTGTTVAERCAIVYRPLLAAVGAAAPGLPATEEGRDLGSLVANACPSTNP